MSRGDQERSSPHYCVKAAVHAGARCKEQCPGCEWHSRGTIQEAAATFDLKRDYRKLGLINAQCARCLMDMYLPEPKHQLEPSSHTTERSGYEPLAQEDIDAMAKCLLNQHELYPLTPGRIKRLCAMAGNALLYAEEIHRLRATPSESAQTFAAPTEGEIAAYRDLFRAELDKNMHNSSGSPSTDAHRVALHQFVRMRNQNGVGR